MQSTPVTLRELTQLDLAYLERNFPEPKLGTHSTRIAGQSKGRFTYSCVEVGGKIAGIILVRWRGPVDRAHLVYSHYPEIGSEYVLPEFRKKGLATLLLHHSEDLIKQRGFDGAGLLIRDNNEASIALHTKEGYILTGIARPSKKDTGAPRTYYVKLFSK